MVSEETTGALIFIGILSVFIIFQFSVIIFVIAMRLRKNALYCSSFFTLFLMVTIIDTVAEIDVMIILKFISVEYLEFLFIGNDKFIAVLYQISSYTLFTQCYIHFAIAINRFYISITTTKNFQNGDSYKKAGKILIWILPFITLPILVPRFWYPAYAYRDPASGKLLPVYNVSLEVRMLIAGYSSALCIISAILSFSLQISTIFQYRRLLKNHSSTTQNKQIYQEIRLLVQAMLVLLAQSIMAVQQFCSLYNYVIGNMAVHLWFNGNYIYFQNVLNLTGPITLMCVAKQIRKDYFNFLFGAKDSSAVFVVSTTSARINSNATANNFTPVR